MGAKMRTMKCGWLLGLLAVTLSMVGCGGTSYKKFDLTVSLSDTYIRESGGATTAVDVVALGGQRAAPLDAYSMSRYWTENDPFRQELLNEGMLWSVELTPGSPSATLPSRDRIWNSKWKTGAKLYILADIVGVGPGPDGRDPRRVALPRDSQLWDTKKLDVLITSHGMPYTPTEKVSGQ